MMKKFEFVAGTPKSDMIMGLCFPISFMFPILLTYLLLFYSGMITYKIHPLFKFLVFLPAFVISYLIMKKIRKSVAKKFIVYIDKINIRVVENEKEIIAGKISFCKIKSNHDKLLKVDIGIDNRKISFISRPKEYKTITGATSFNPFGISDISDMSRLLTLGREVQELIEKQGEN
jgi:hypothetical protein